MDISKIEPHTERIAELVHEVWMKNKAKDGFHSPAGCPAGFRSRFAASCAKCHPDMYPYSELPEKVKKYDRVTVQSVLDAISEIDG